MRRTIATSSTPGSNKLGFNNLGFNNLGPNNVGSNNPRSITSGRWRRRRTARIVAATALVVAAPFVGHADSDNSHNADATTSGGAGTLAAAQAGTPLGSDTPGSPTASGASVSGSPPTAGNDGGAMRVVPVPLADPAVADALDAGNLVDLVAIADSARAPEPPPGGEQGSIGPVVVARAALVRAIPAGRPGARSILVEVPDSVAPYLAATAATTPLAVIVHG